jgi:hypothetical protein
MRLTARLSVLRAELRVLGIWIFLVPFAVMGSLVTFGGWLDLRGTVDHGFIASLLTAALEASVPLAAGVLAATIAGRDDALELQLTVATPYRRTARRRIGLLLLWTALVEAATMLGIEAFLPWAAPRQGIEYVLMWAAPLLWLTGVGALLALLLRSRATAGAGLGVVWIAQLALHGYFLTSDWLRPWFLFTTLFSADASFWWANRLELLLAAVVFFAAAWYYLRNAEWRFRAEEA